MSRAREQGARDSLHALLYSATRVIEGEAPPAEGAALTAVELEIAALVRAQPSLSGDCVDFLSRALRDDSSAVLLKAARVLGAVLSANDAAFGHCARRRDDLMARLATLSSSYQIPLLPVDEEPVELLVEGSVFQGQFRSVRAGGMDLMMDLSCNSVSAVESGEEVGEWDSTAGMVRLATDQAAQDAVRRSASALLGELEPKRGGGKHVVAASLQQAIASVGGSVAAAGAQVAAATFPDERHAFGRVSRSQQDGKRAREQGARDTLYAMLYQATSCTDGETLPDQGTALTAPELEIAALIRAQPPLGADCVDFLARRFQSESSGVLLKAARVLGVAMSADDSLSTDKSSPLQPVQAPESVASCVRRSPALLQRIVALSRYTCERQATDTGGVDGSLKTVRANGVDYVVDMESFIAFVGEEEVGTCASDQRTCCIARYVFRPHVEQMRSVLTSTMQLRTVVHRLCRG
jgi:hypothetical protein